MSQGLTSDRLSQLKSYTEYNLSRSQLEYYTQNNASPEIMRYVPLQGKTFGEKCMEPIAKEYFNLESRNDSGHDHVKNEKTLEQKSARWHGNGNDWKWQHIEMNHDWDCLLLCGLDFNDIKYYIASRKIVEALIKDGIITGQGKKNKNGVAQPQQAYWFSRSDFNKKNKYFTDYFTPINNEEELIQYLNHI